VIKKALGKRIAALRRAKDLSQESLAERCGYSVEFVSLVERGVNAPSVDGLARLAGALGVEVRELFNFSEVAK